MVQRHDDAKEGDGHTMAVAADEQVPLICGIAEPDLGCLTIVDCTALPRSARERASTLIAAVRYRQVSVLKGKYASCKHYCCFQVPGTAFDA